MIIGLLILFTILFAHWVADFICQTHWMATNKSKNWTALTYHVIIYTVVMTLFMAWWLPVVMILPFATITFVTHFVTDAITSRITSYLWTKGDVHNFFVVVGFDQFIHYVTLIGTVLWLTM